MIEISKSMGVEYEQVMAWTATNEFWAHILELCRMSCAANADLDSLFSRLPVEKAFRYQLECDDELIARYPTPEAQQQFLKDVKRR